VEAYYSSSIRDSLPRFTDIKAIVAHIERELYESGQRMQSFVVMLLIFISIF
jgi:hypothetical protein